jgi:hypothetical protein
MLSPAFLFVDPAISGLVALPAGEAAAPGFGFAGLAAAAVFAALLGLFAIPSDAAEPEAGDAWVQGLDRRVAALCAAAFMLKGGLCGVLAWAAWGVQGPGGALGLGAAALAFLSAALAFGGRALRR